MQALLSCVSHMLPNRADRRRAVARRPLLGLSLLAAGLILSLGAASAAGPVPAGEHALKEQAIDGQGTGAGHDRDLPAEPSAPVGMGWG